MVDTEKNNKIKLLIEQIICEELSVDEPVGGPLGKVAFAPQRTDKVEKEPNTPKEDVLYSSIERHVLFHDSEMLSSYFDDIYKLAKSGKYKNMFKPPSGPSYRLLYNLNEQDIQNILKIPKKALVKDDHVGVANNANVLQPKNSHGLQSWITELNMTGLYELIDSGERGTYVAIVKTTVPSGGKFILNPEITQKIGDFKAFADEYEIVSKGPVKINGGVYCNVFIEPETSEASVFNRLKEMISALGAGE